MSSIFGIINLNDKPVKHDDLLSMQTAMGYWGPDGQYLYSEENAGLGQLQLFNTPESKHEKFPLSDPSGNLKFVAACRIDNREELFQKLDIPFEKRITLQNGNYREDQQSRVITDAELIFLSFQKYGKDCVHHLLGDYAFAIWNKKEKELFLARDHYGMTSMYYTFQNNIFVFSSSLKGMKALPYISLTPNLKVIKFILHGQKPDGQTTVYKEIKRLQPSRLLTINTKTLNVNTYNDLLHSKNKFIDYHSEKDYFEEYRKIIDQAVFARLRSVGSISTTLSAGIDSGVITSTAARLMPNDTIYSFTSSPLYNTAIEYNRWVADESILAHELTGMYPNIKHITFRCENKSPIDGLKKSHQIQDEPVCSYNNAYWLTEMMHLAQIENCKVMLIGQGGNATISWKHDINIYTYKYLDFWPINAYSFIRKRIYKPQKWNIAKANNSFWSRLGYFYGIEVRDPSLDKRVIDFCISARYPNFTNNRNATIELFKNDMPQNILLNKRRGLQSSDLQERLKKQEKEIEEIASPSMNNYTQKNLLQLKRNNLNYKKCTDLLKSISFELFFKTTQF